MATPQEKLAEALEALKDLQDRHVVAIRTRDLSRTHRERLLRNGFIREVMKGWYIPTRPGERDGDSTAWYASFWDFCAAYLRARFGEDWCLSPEQSLSLHGGNRAVPAQLLVRTPKGGNKPTTLLHGTSIFDMRLNMPREQDVIEQDGLRLFSLPAALIEASPGFFTQHPTDARTALAAVADPSELLRRQLEGGHSAIAGRLAGAFRNIGRTRIADDIVSAMKAADYEIREQDPFAQRIEPAIPPRANARPMRTVSGSCGSRCARPWQTNFPEAPGVPNDIEAYLARVEDIYVTDAYHSLSIEGYRVSAELIERVRSGTWNPDVMNRTASTSMHSQRVATGRPSRLVKKSVLAVLENQNPGTVADDDHGSWYREMFAPSVTAGIMRPESLAGYRDGQVYIRRSMHVPLPPHARPRCDAGFLRDAAEEDHPGRARRARAFRVRLYPPLHGR